MARVLFVTSSYPAYPGDPSGHFVETEARLRAHAGSAVVVLAPGASASAELPAGAPGSVSVVRAAGGDAFGWPGVLCRLRRRPARTLDVVRFVHSARRTMSRLGAFDEVIAHWILPSAWPVALAASGPIEVVAHGSDVRLFERLPRLLRRAIAASLLGRGARFRFVSRELEARFVRSTTDAVLARSRVEPSPIDVGAVPPRAVLRARLGLGDETVAVVVGRLTCAKDPERAARIAARHARRVVVIGDGPLEAVLRRSVPDAVLCGKLSRPDTLAWIAAADVLVSASRAEGAPTVVREARALGTRVLAVPAGDIAERAAQDPGIALLPFDDDPRASCAGAAAPSPGRALLAEAGHELDEVAGAGTRVELR